jgi:hypothetical protein
MRAYSQHPPGPCCDFWTILNPIGRINQRQAVVGAQAHSNDHFLLKHSVVVCSIGKRLTTLSTLSSMDSGYMLKPYSSFHTRTQDSNSHGRSIENTSPTNGHFSIRRTSIPTGLDTDDGYTALIKSSPPSDASRTKPSRSSFLRWWFPEILASIISVASLLSTVIVVRHYDGLGLNNLNLPNSLTLNGIIAAIATINRVALMVPVGSAMSQEVWLWFSSVAHKDTCHSRFLDLHLSDAASRGAWGSLVFLLVARKRFVPTSLIPDVKLISIDGSLILALS